MGDRMSDHEGRLPLSAADFALAASGLGCEPELLRAIAAVESKRGGFDAQGRPTILFEPHVFGALTDHRFHGARCGVDGAAGVISRKAWAPGTYGTYGQQWIRLEAAQQLDNEAALKATSWGRFQILGRDQAGWPSIDAFVAAMWESEQEHLRALVAFLEAKGLGPALRDRDFEALARGYNGASYRMTKWDQKVEAAYLRLSSTPDPAA